jgi:hypothetical protein
VKGATLGVCLPAAGGWTLRRVHKPEEETMDSRVQQLIAAHRLQEDIRGAAAARAAKAARAGTDRDAGTARGRFRHRRLVVATRRFVRRSQASIGADR